MQKTQLLGYYTVAKSKMPTYIILRHGGMPSAKSQFKSLDLFINSAMRKIFDTKSQDVVDTCRDIFNCSSAE